MEEMAAMNSTATTDKSQSMENVLMFLINARPGMSYQVHAWAAMVDTPLTTESAEFEFDHYLLLLIFNYFLYLFIYSSLGLEPIVDWLFWYLKISL